ncbi:MAG: hypothetical protein HQK76_07265 [Desulfobacterales bacterium]|nr:hypothetical protein [Desulfobacterales bacterium]
MAKFKGRKALDIIEQAVSLLKSSPVEHLTIYYVGTVPFFLGVIYFWIDFSTSPFAYAYCGISSFWIGLLFIWMKFFHSIYTINMLSFIGINPYKTWSIKRIISMFSNQTLIHATGLIVLPVSLVLSVPFPWAYAFYQHVLYQENKEIKKIYKKAWTDSKLWPIQNHIIIFIFFIFGFFVYINIFSALYILPNLIKILFGYEFFIVKGGFDFFNSTFLMIVFSITYLCIDPIIKAVYVFRGFYGDSIKLGYDLKSEIKLNFSSISSLILLCLIFFTFFSIDIAYSSDNLNLDKTVSSEELEESIKKTMSKSEYAWKFPKDGIEKEYKEMPGPLEYFFESVIDFFKKIENKIRTWLNKLKFEDKLNTDKKTKKHSLKEWNQYYLWIILIIFAVINIVYALLYLYKKHRNINGSSAFLTDVSGTDIFDLSNENILADEKAPSEWILLGKNLIEQGLFRLAVRAYFLGILSFLSDKRLIVIEKYKSNRDYIKDLKRRELYNNEILSIFSSQVELFDKTWYGRHDLTFEKAVEFVQSQERLMLL